MGQGLAKTTKFLNSLIKVSLDCFPSVGLGKALAVQLLKFLASAFVASATAICLSGCATADHSGAAVVKQWNARFNSSDGGQGTTPWSGGTPAMNVRDFVYEGIAVKDYEYKKYVDLIRRGTSWGGFSAQAVSIGLGAAGGLLSGSAQVLSGASSAVNGGSAAFSKHILFDQSITTFVGRMDALRTTKLEYIKGRLTDPNYSYAEAYRDVEDYGHQGSLDAAVSDVAKKSGVEEAMAKGEVLPTATATSATTTTTETTTTPKSKKK
jgi:hypothetical protein